MVRPYTTREMSDHYGRRHELRKGLYGERPFANYGYWIREGMDIDAACTAMTDLVAEELAINARDRVLECGCGYGASAVHIAGKYAPEKIVGIDVTEIRIQNAKKLIEESGLEGRVSVDFGDAVAMSFEDASFSKLMAIECVFHFNTRKDFFAEAFRVLEPGGVMALTDIVPALDLDISHLTVPQIREFLCADAARYPDANVYGVDTYEAYLREVGFSAVTIYSIKEHVVLPFADYVEKAALRSEAEARERRLASVDCFRNKHYVGGDYVVVRAEKPSA